MSVVTKELPWARIEVDAFKGVVTVLQRWGYQWVTAMGASAWTDAEKTAFHTKAVQLIKTRIKKQKLQVSARNLCLVHPKMDLNFDIGRALEKYKHWTVYVRKLPAGSSPTTLISQVDWNTRTIYLDSADLADYKPCNAASVCQTFNAVPHEFMHTFRGPDEYVSGSPHLSDSSSILNIGDQLRTRHIRVILDELNTMMPGWTFAY